MIQVRRAPDVLRKRIEINDRTARRDCGLRLNAGPED